MINRIPHNVQCIFKICQTSGDFSSFSSYPSFVPCQIKSLQNVQLGKTETNSVNQFGSKFREHLGQWRLNKRGVEGETIIHLLLNREEPMCSEIARILITRYPGLANDIYLGDEMFGKNTQI